MTRQISVSYYDETIWSTFVDAGLWYGIYPEMYVQIGDPATGAAIGDEQSTSSKNIVLSAAPDTSLSLRVVVDDHVAYVGTISAGNDDLALNLYLPRYNTDYLDETSFDGLGSGFFLPYQDTDDARAASLEWPDVVLEPDTAASGHNLIDLSKQQAAQYVGTALSVRVSGTDTDDFVFNAQTAVRAQLLGGNDVITASNLSDSIDAGDGWDRVQGAQGGDWINGGLGNDRLRGGDDGDNMVGGADNDFLHGNTGNDTIFGESGHDVIRGGDGNDILYGGAGRDLIGGGDGDDIIHGGAHADTMAGGAGNDQLTVDSLGDVARGGTGNDTIAVWASSTLYGGEDRDRFEFYDFDGIAMIHDYENYEDHLSFQVYSTSAVEITDTVGGVLFSGGGATVLVVSDTLTSEDYFRLDAGLFEIEI